MEFLNVFASVDKDEDLVIHEADLDAYAAQMKYEKAFTRKWLRLFDQDKDGKFTFGEFCETLGLDEKIYEEKLRQVRKNLAEKQQQQQQQQQQDQEKAERATRRESRLPRQQATVDKPIRPEVKENVQPQSQRPQRSMMSAPKVQEKSVAKEEIVEEEMVKPQMAQKAKAGVPEQEEMVKPQMTQKVKAGVPEQKEPKSSPEEVHLEFDDGDPRSIEVEFADMDPKELEEVKALLAALGSQSRKTGESPAEFDRRMMHELDKKRGKTWQCQTNPELSPKEVNYQEGYMAVLVAKPQKRVMLWKPQPVGGMCCCS